MMLGGPKGHKAQIAVIVFMFFGYLPGRRRTIFGPLASYAGSREGNPAGNCDAHLRYSRRLLCTIILHTIPIGFVSRVASLQLVCSGIFGFSFRFVFPYWGVELR